ncbi:molybdenum ABC transporter permease [Galbibacter sp. EGI 63066]|uniref:molybdenum ABC transporter permease n=1 Tax=Galbibacter sp. EGI 63066 TaxID=2993559 RepID=UPI002248D3B2|nr:molybdenum ABC transporter permease [Galbibacter sp. EGI 63066]MCX2681007.1 molybdenum ABC transporter permease [Galbibacter sp. EGI 63066]
MEVMLRVAGILLLAIGIVIRYIISRRKFNRRNPAGLEQFTSFERSIGVRIIELIFSLTGAIFILTGGILLLFSYKEEIDGFLHAQTA